MIAAPHALHDAASVGYMRTIGSGIYSSKADYEKRVYELMDMAGLAKRFANAYPHELDGGRRQRVGIARAGAQWAPR